MSSPTKITANLGLKILSLLIAIILWFVVLGSRNVEVTKDIPVEIITPADLIVSNDVSDKVAFRLSGPKAFLRNIVSRKEAPIRVDLSGAKAGLITYRFYSDNIQVPIGVKVLSINPTAMLIKLEYLKHKDVPVRLLTKGEAPSGYHVSRIQLTKNAVRIRGAESRIDQIFEVLTQPFDLSQLTATGTREVPLDLSQHTGLLVDGELPKVHFDVVRATANFRIRNASIKVMSSRKYEILPKDVTVYVRCSSDQIKNLDRSKVYAYVDLRNRGAGHYESPLSVQLPSTIKLIKVSPSKVKVTLY